MTRSGRLAVAEDEPQLAAYIVHQAVTSVRTADGRVRARRGWAEGPGYWDYATQYNVYMLAALEARWGPISA